MTFSPIVDVLKSYLGKKIWYSHNGTGYGIRMSWIFRGYSVAKKVLFVGQDMCVRPDGKYYTNDSSYSDNGSHYTNKLDGHRLRQNTSKEVIVEGRLYVYLKTFEKFISDNPSIEYRNLAATGVKVKGADYIDFDTAKSWIEGSRSSAIFSRNYPITK